MRYTLLALVGALAWLALMAGTGYGGPGAVGAATDSDGDGVLDQADSCPSLAEDLDGADDLDGCPDTDVYLSAATDATYSVSISSTDTRTVEIWIQNGNYPADILVHALSVSTIGACEVSLIPAPGDGDAVFITDENGDTVEDTYSYLLEWQISLDAGESYHTTRDYEVYCSLLGEHSFEMQVDAVPLPPVEEEDVEDLPNVHKIFPLVTVTDDPPLDSDGDGFSDATEAFVGTDAADACPDNEDDDAWPADLATIDAYGKHDGKSDIFDINELTPPVFGKHKGDPLYDRRKDFTGDDVIDIFDITRLAPPVFGTRCSP
jgi:hypothetical protein